MVKATLADLKTNTRRPVKPQPLSRANEVLGQYDHLCANPVTDDLNDSEYGKWALYGRFSNGIFRPVSPFFAPKYQPGDRLWVREAFVVDSIYDDLPPRNLPDIGDDLCIHYLADEPLGSWGLGRYRHARFMPKRFARIWLEVVSVKVERLKEITLKDIFAEGVPRMVDSYQENYQGQGHASIDIEPIHKAGFASLWDSIYAKTFPWDANPWVWVYEFKPLHPNQSERS